MIKENLSEDPKALKEKVTTVFNCFMCSLIVYVVSERLFFPEVT